MNDLTHGALFCKYEIALEVLAYLRMHKWQVYVNKLSWSACYALECGM
jgi:hypothetical protein